MHQSQLSITVPSSPCGRVSASDLAGQETLTQPLSPGSATLVSVHSGATSDNLWMYSSWASVLSRPWSQHSSTMSWLLHFHSNY